MTRPPLCVGALLLAGVVFGCNRQAGISRPKLNAAEAAQRAVAQFDTNGDGLLSGSELDGAPYLSHIAKKLKQSQLSETDLEQRFKGYFNSPIIMTGASCRVLLNGRPLEGATVHFEPPAFMGEVTPPAIAVTDARGIGRPTQPGEPGLYLGVYNVRVSKQVDAKELIPTRYNEQTELGIEMAFEGSTIKTDFDLAVKTP